MHGTAPAPTAQAVTDLTKPDARDRAKRFESNLKRHGKVRGIVQFVANGARFKLLIPKENVLISFACVGMRCPQYARPLLTHTPPAPPLSTARPPPAEQGRPPPTA